MTQLTAEKDLKVLFNRFYEAYQELREVWLKTGGGMDMEIKIRDAAAEAAFKRRSAASKKAAAKQRLKPRESVSFSPNFDERNGIK